MEKAEEVIKKMQITSDKLVEESRQRDTQHWLITVCADVSIRKIDEKFQNAKEKLEGLISTAKERMNEVIKKNGIESVKQRSEVERHVKNLGERVKSQTKENSNIQKRLQQLRELEGRIMALIDTDRNEVAKKIKRLEAKVSGLDEKMMRCPNW